LLTVEEAVQEKEIASGFVYFSVILLNNFIASRLYAYEIKRIESFWAW
jgi:hypothetical protein